MPRSSGFGKSRVGVLVVDGQDYLRAMWFNQPFMRENLRVGQHVLLSAKPRLRGGRWEMAHPRVTWLEGEEDQPRCEAAAALFAHRRRLRNSKCGGSSPAAVERFGAVLEEVFPPSSCSRSYDLMPLAEALPAIHRPGMPRNWLEPGGGSCFRSCSCCNWPCGAAPAAAARVSLRQSARATAEIDARIRRLFPFELTAGQQAAIREVAADMARDGR